MEKKRALVIREAGPDDAPIIALLGRLTFGQNFGHYFRDHNDLLEYYETTFSVSKIRASLYNNDNVFWLALVNELPVGYSKLKLSSTSPFIDAVKVCQLQKIYVLKDFLAQRIGHQLQGCMLAKAGILGFNHIWLSVLNSNERAIQFYLRNGFGQIGHHEFSIGKENFSFLVMSKHEL